MPERACVAVRKDISALIDGELDPPTAADVGAHLANCHRCRRYEETMRSIKRAVRLQPAATVPDVRPRVMARIVAEAPLVLRRREQHRLGRIIAVAAITTIVFLAGTATLWRARPPQIASADEIASSVQRAARALDTYRATFAIEERGWHPAVATREFVAEVWFDAPERFKMRVRDLTAYPDGTWPANTVEIVASPRRWTISEPTTCPVEVLPSCGATGMERRTLTQRQPFDGTTALPTDIILPVQTLATSSGFEVLGTGPISGRDAYRLALTYAEARPMIDALQAGGSWRSFSPETPVTLWIDRETWFPLRFSVMDAASGRPALTVRATSFSEPRLSSDLFRAAPAGIVKSGAFHMLRADAGVAVPSYSAGLHPYRSGRTDNGSVVHTFAKGMTWLKLTYSLAGTTLGGRPEASEAIDTGGGVAYYRPADGTLRRALDMYGAERHLRIETNLERAELVKVAGSMDFEARPAPYPPGLRAAELDVIATLDFASLPTYLPAGYEHAASYTIEGEAPGAVVFYRRPEVEYDGLGIRVTQMNGVRSLAPSSESFGSVSLGGLRARWSAERGELEWVDAGVYRAVAAPSLGRAEVERIAEGLR